MDISRTLKGSMTLIRRYGIMRGINRGINQLIVRSMSSIDGQNVFDEDWDLLVVLDACRVDELQAALAGRDTGHFGDDEPRLVDSFPSVATTTRDWIPRTFSNTPADEVVAYVTANPYSTILTEQSEQYIVMPDTIDEVWQDQWNDEKGTVLPRSVTDRAISLSRDRQFDRIIVHYLQPHAPFLTDDHDSDATHFKTEGGDDLGTWGLVQRGDLSRKVAINGYRANLEIVLDEVELLLDNINADKAVITADHGEAFGERSIFGHPPDTPLDCLKYVPWYVSQGTDNHTHNPDLERKSASNDISVGERLNALGYVDDQD